MVSFPATDNQRYFRKDDILKFILTIVIVFDHAVNIHVYHLDEMSGIFPRLLYYGERGYLTTVYIATLMFFALSGYSFFTNFSFDKLFTKLKRRFFTLFLPFVIWNTIMWAFGIAAENIPFLSRYMNSGFGYELSFASWFKDGLIACADGPLWFMRNLIAVVLIAPIFYPLLKNRYLGIVAIVGLIVAAKFAGIGYYSVLLALICFLEAGYLAIHHSALVNREYGKGLKLAALGVMIFYFFYSIHIDYHASFPVVFIVQFIFPAIWILTPDRKLGPKLQKLDEHRFWLYCGHYLPLECIEKLWYIIGGASAFAALTDFIFAPILAIALVIFISAIVRKIFPRVWTVLNGKFKPAPKNK